MVVPAYDAAGFLPAALESVFAQDFPDFEVVVVDDGSRDATPAVIAGYAARVRSFRQDNAGVAAARNRGVRESRGRYVAFLDADDSWRRDKLSRQLAALRRQPAARASASAFDVTDESGVVVERRGGPFEGPVLEVLVVEGNLLGTPSSMLCERELLLELGGFDPRFSQCADWDLWIRLAQATSVAMLPEPLVCYRQHAGNMSRSIALLEADSVGVLEKTFGGASVAPVLRPLRRQAFARNYRILAGSYYRARAFSGFLRCAMRALLLDPREAAYFAAFPLRAGRRRLG